MENLQSRLMHKNEDPSIEFNVKPCFSPNLVRDKIRHKSGAGEVSHPGEHEPADGPQPWDVSVEQGRNEVPTPGNTYVIKQAQNHVVNCGFYDVYILPGVGTCSCPCRGSPPS